MIVGSTDSAYRKIKTTFGEIKSQGDNIKNAVGIQLLNANERVDRLGGKSILNASMKGKNCQMKC